MLNEEKVILMTHMASYENGEGKENVKIGNYFRSDYIAVQVLKSAICGTIAYGIGFGLYALYNMEILLQDFFNSRLIIFSPDLKELLIGSGKFLKDKHYCKVNIQSRFLQLMQYPLAKDSFRRQVCTACLEQDAQDRWRGIFHT